MKTTTGTERPVPRWLWDTTNNCVKPSVTTIDVMNIFTDVVLNDDEDQRAFNDLKKNRSTLKFNGQFWRRVRGESLIRPQILDDGDVSEELIKNLNENEKTSVEGEVINNGNCYTTVNDEYWTTQDSGNTWNLAGTKPDENVFAKVTVSVNIRRKMKETQFLTLEKEYDVDIFGEAHFDTNSVLRTASGNLWQPRKKFEPQRTDADRELMTKLDDESSLNNFLFLSFIVDAILGKYVFNKKI